MGCAVGACLGCVVMTTSGTPQRVCREGPVFAAEEIDWESAWADAARRRRSTRRAPAGEGKAPGSHLIAPRRRAEIPASPKRLVTAPRHPRVRPPRRARKRRTQSRPPTSTCRSTLAAASSCRIRSSSRRGRSATASSTATSSTSTASAAICCKGTTLKPRIGNPTPRVSETPGGMLNSIGLQNPGVDAVIEKYAATWTPWQVPVIVNVAGESVADYVEVARRLDGVPGVAGIELNISCPNVGRGRTPVRDRRERGRRGHGRGPASDGPAAARQAVAECLRHPPHRAGDRGRGRRRAHRDQHAVGHRGRTCPGAAPRQHLRRPERPGRQAGRAADRLRGRPGRPDPRRRHRRRDRARGRPRLPGRRRRRRPGRHGDLRRPGAPHPSGGRAGGGVRAPRARSYRDLIGTALPSKKTERPSAKGVEYRP